MPGRADLGRVKVLETACPAPPEAAVVASTLPSFGWRIGALEAITL